MKRSKKYEDLSGLGYERENKRYRSSDSLDSLCSCLSEQSLSSSIQSNKKQFNIGDVGNLLRSTQADNNLFPSTPRQDDSSTSESYAMTFEIVGKEMLPSSNIISCSSTQNNQNSSTILLRISLGLQV